MVPARFIIYRATDSGRGGWYVEYWRTGGQLAFASWFPHWREVVLIFDEYPPRNDLFEVGDYWNYRAEPRSEQAWGRDI